MTTMCRDALRGQAHHPYNFSLLDPGTERANLVPF
jgi:hypothetical protein